VEPFFSVSLHNYFLVRPEKSNFTDKAPRFMEETSNYTEEMHGKSDWKTGFIQRSGSSSLFSLAG
jgi:hypothetical protein